MVARRDAGHSVRVGQSASSSVANFDATRTTSTLETGSPAQLMKAAILKKDLVMAAAEETVAAMGKSLAPACGSTRAVKCIMERITPTAAQAVSGRAERRALVLVAKTQATSNVPDEFCSWFHAPTAGASGKPIALWLLRQDGGRGRSAV